MAKQLRKEVAFLLGLNTAFIRKESVHSIKAVHLILRKGSVLAIKAGY